MEVEISDELQEVVDGFEMVGKRTEAFLSSTVNPVGYDRLADELDSFDNQLSGVETDSEFEELVVDELDYRIDAIREMADFMTLKSDTTVPEAVDTVHGEGTYDRLRKDTLEYDFESEYESSWRSSSRSKVDPRRSDLEVDLKEELQIIKEIVDEYARENDIFPDDFSYDVVSIPANREQRASWNGEHNEVRMSEDYFDVLKDNGEVTVDATNIIRTYFHEVLGHGVHQTNSEGIRFPRFNPRVTRSPTTQAHIEGIAKRCDKKALEFLEEYGDVLPVTQEGVDILRHNSQNNMNSRSAFIQFVKEQERRGEIDSAVSVLSQSYPEFVAEQTVENSSMSLYDAFKESSYAAGNVLMDRVDYDDRSTYALTTGAWSPEVLHRAVEYIESELE